YYEAAGSRVFRPQLLETASRHYHPADSVERVTKHERGVAEVNERRRFLRLPETLSILADEENPLFNKTDRVAGPQLLKPSIAEISIYKRDAWLEVPPLPLLDHIARPLPGRIGRIEEHPTEPATR